MTATLNRPTTLARRQRIAPLDRQWMHAGSTVCILGPLQGLERAAVVDAVRTLAAAGAQTRIGLIAEADGKHWTYDPQGLAEQAERMVTVEPPASAATVDALAQRLGAAASAAGPYPAGGSRSPVRVVLAGEWFALVMQHALGDGFISLQICTAIVSIAQGGPLPNWTELEPTARPLTTALLRTFARHPGKALTVVRSRTAPVRGGTAPARGGTAPVRGGTAPVRGGTAPARSANHPGESGVHPWVPAPEVLSARTSTAGRRDLHEWRRVNAPDASMAAVTLSLVRRGLVQAGLELDPASSVAINGRRYLSRTAVVQGNFAGRLDFIPADADDPVALSAAIDAATALGRPLATIAASIVGARLARRATVAPVSAAPVDLPVRVGYSFFGRPMAVERLDWAAGPDARRIVAWVEPGQPPEIGWCVFQVGGGLQLSASFHHSSYDRELVRTALDRMCADPVAVMEADHG